MHESLSRFIWLVSHLTESILGKIRGKGKDIMEGSEHEDSDAESELS